uniref:Uncharacterized protein n=1 Tax=Neolamprologus brichardi TaxID=32507 RepID=A0A3Q4H832_NEOBR
MPITSPEPEQFTVGRAPTSLRSCRHSSTARLLVQVCLGQRRVRSSRQASSSDSFQPVALRGCEAPAAAAAGASFAGGSELCCKLHKQIDLVDEERYNMEVKVAKSNKVDDLKLKIQYLNGRFKKPVLNEARMSADAMLAALLAALGSKHKVSMDLRASLKQVKKEVKDEVGTLDVILEKSVKMFMPV